MFFVTVSKNVIASENSASAAYDAPYSLQHERGSCERKWNTADGLHAVLRLVFLREFRLLLAPRHCAVEHVRRFALHMT